MKHPRCPCCSYQQPAKRNCPPLETAICGPCCATKRSWHFCDLDCPFFKDNKITVPIEVGRGAVSTADGGVGATHGAIYYPNIFDFAKASVRKLSFTYKLGLLDFEIELALNFSKKSSKVYGADNWKVLLSKPPLINFTNTQGLGPLCAIAPPSGGMIFPSNLSITRDGNSLDYFLDSAVGYHVLPFGRPAYFGPAPPPEGICQFYRLFSDVIWAEIKDGVYRIRARALLGTSSLSQGSIYILVPFGNVELLQEPNIVGPGISVQLSKSIYSPGSGNLLPFEQLRDGKVAVFSTFVGGFTRPDIPPITGDQRETTSGPYPLIKISFEANPEPIDLVSAIIPTTHVSPVLKRFLGKDHIYGKVIIHIYNPAQSAAYVLTASSKDASSSTSKTEIVGDKELKTILLDIPLPSVPFADMEGQVRIVVQKNGTCIFDETTDTILAGTQTWIYEVTEYGGSWRSPLIETLGFYINPLACEVEEVLKYAIQRHPLKQLAGTQDDLEPQIRAIFEAIKHDLQINYISTTLSFGLANNEAGQRLRSFQEILEAKAGNCIDLSILFASIMESLGIPGGILLMPGHAMPFWYDKDVAYPLEIVVPIGTAYEKAKRDAITRIGQFKKEQLSWVDTKRCREKGFRPFQELLV